MVDTQRSVVRMAAENFMLFEEDLWDASIFDQIENMCRRPTV